MNNKKINENQTELLASYTVLNPVFSAPRFMSISGSGPDIENPKDTNLNVTSKRGIKVKGHGHKSPGLRGTRAAGGTEEEEEK
jgi:hypothetical protein